MPQITKPLIGRKSDQIWHERNRETMLANRILPSDDILPSYGPDGVTLGFARPSRKGGSGASVTKLILSDAANPDYLICRAWDGYYWQARRELRTENGEAPDNATLLTRINSLRADDELEAWEASDLTTYLEGETLVAKPPSLRADAMDGKEIDVEVESWDGVTLTSSTTKLSFAYPSATLRVVTNEDTSAEETQVIIPYYIVEESVIFAISSNQTEVEVDGSPVRIMDLNIDARAWMKQA